ncbi:MAG: hypothetical protein A3J74_06745 [Elusimicrobia bacterium RIFCSPHIGHO2_02_FULL_57_9]|nr:MAG: hypothetical protein A3J74_06745 [Elusimicrobia bacterium RIFCSPHIGHO2_02_FULL_57_9]
MAPDAAVKWHEEVLDASGLEAAGRLAKAAGRDFYLAGGTALGLRVGHRISLDLDLFSADNRLNESQREALVDQLKASGPISIQTAKDGTCHFLLKSTSVSICHYPYVLKAKTDVWRGLKVASFDDIGAMKVSAIIGRGLRKDFIDLRRICDEIGLEKVLATCVKKFSDSPDFFLQAARALVDFNDAEKEPMPRLLEPLGWEDIKLYFESEARKAFKKRL